MKITHIKANKRDACTEPRSDRGGVARQRRVRLWRKKSHSLEIPAEVTIEEKIFVIRGQKVMLSAHLAKLYGVEAKVLIQSVKRNIERFPSDFMFQLSNEEYKILKSQFVTSSWGGIRRANPYAFTEQGVAMLSSVLHSKQAIQVNITIMRAFTRLKHIIYTNREIVSKLKEHDVKIERHDEDIIAIFKAIHQLIKEEEKPNKKFGFIQ